MSTPLTPAEELLDAARIVREYAGKATGGQWLALFATNDGWPIDDCDPGCGPDDEFSGDQLSLVCGSSLPKDNGRLPGTYQSHHILAEHDDDLPPGQAAELFGSLKWAALLCPLIAEPLAALFEREAKVINRRHPSDDNPALNLARVIRQQREVMQRGED